MRVNTVRVQNYKSIQDSGDVDFNEVLALVGPNEAGKTAFLQALTKFNPINREGSYDVTHEYPRINLTDYQPRHPNDPDPVVTLALELEDGDISQLDSVYGNGILEQNTVEVTKYYDGSYHWDLNLDEQGLVDELIESHDLPSSTERSVEDVSTIDELWSEISESTARTRDFPEFGEKVESLANGDADNHIGRNYLQENLPKFLYFDEYDTMEGAANIHELASRSQHELSSGEQTFLSFLSLAGFDPEQLIEMTDFEDVIAQLEAVSESLSQEVFEYWSQGPHLQVRIRDKTEVTDNGQEQLILQVRIRNERHGNTLPFGERSRGFIWFFSFLAYFSHISENYGHDDITLLLDEPGLNLHPEAQSDLLRFINDRLAPDHTVVYTTHSPFMLEPSRLERARLVEDQDDEETDEIIGTKISDDILNFGEDTVFPLQAALGIDVIQTLLVGPEVLLVEGSSDIRYLNFMSELLLSQGREHLAQRWTLIPVGGADNASQFVNLFAGSGLTTVVLLDSDQEVEQRMGSVLEQGLIERDQVLTTEDYVGEESDIEDIFSDEFYLELVEHAYARELDYNRDVDELDLGSIDFQHPRIVKEVEHFFEAWVIGDGDFAHGKPAKHLEQNRDRFEDQIPDEDKDNFESLIQDINENLPD